MTAASAAAVMNAAIEPPLALLAELTHRCPLQCPYCSNPLALERARAELPTEVWLDVLRSKCDILWAMLDALYFAYVSPGLVPPGAFVPGPS